MALHHATCPLMLSDDSFYYGGLETYSQGHLKSLVHPRNNMKHNNSHFTRAVRNTFWHSEIVKHKIELIISLGNDHRGQTVRTSLGHLSDIFFVTIILVKASTRSLATTCIISILSTHPSVHQSSHPETPWCLQQSRWMNLLEHKYLADISMKILLCCTCS